jgi:hypothetical protein
MPIPPDPEKRSHVLAEGGKRIAVRQGADELGAKADEGVVGAVGVAEEPLKRLQRHAVEGQIVRRRDLLLERRDADGALLHVPQQRAADAVAVRQIKPVLGLRRTRSLHPAT